MNKSEIAVKFRCSESQKRKIISKAKKAKMTIKDYCLTQLLKAN